jgi:hypothetical protein
VHPKRVRYNYCLLLSPNVSSFLRRVSLGFSGSNELNPNKIDADAADKLGQKYGQVELLTGARHSKGGKLEYEVHFYGTRDKENKYICREDLEAMGFGPLCRQVRC